MSTIRVLNKTRRPLIFFETDGEIQLRPGVWVNVPAEFAMVNLSQMPGIELDYGQETPDSLPLPHLLVAGPADRLTGWGNLVERFIHHMAHSDYALSYMPVGYPHDHADTSPIVKALWTRHSRLPTDAEGRAIVPRHDHALVFSLPYNLPRIPARRRILYSMYEATTFPARDQGLEWPQYVNQYAEALIVPSRHQAEVWRDFVGQNGAHVTVPIHVAGLGVDAERWAYVERSPRPEGTPFTILLYGTLSGRKSPLETVAEVCYRAFRGLDDWRLILKTTYGQFGAGDFGGDFINDPHVEKISSHYSLAQMHALCARADAGVFLSRFEGYGLPPLEMMATGLPVVLTDYSGLADNIGVGIPNIPVAIKRITPAGQGYGGLEGWGEPNWHHAAIALRREYDEWHARGRTQSPLGTMAAGWIRRNRTWEQATARLLEVLKEVIGDTVPHA